MPKAKRQRKGRPAKQPPLPSANVPVLALTAWGTKEHSSNSHLGFCKIPFELTNEILSYYPAVGALTKARPILPVRYLERLAVLRALSQTCVAYRRIFLPILWERLEACVASEGKEQFFRHAGETLIRKCTGLIENTELAAMIRTVNVILTRYKPDTVLPAFTKCLKALPNLHTINILHAHAQMTSQIKAGFEGITLPTVRKLIIPGYCHELLKCCPEVRSVHCTRDNGSKLVTVIKKCCKNVEEMRGFNLEDLHLTKRFVAAVPNLRTLEVTPRGVTDETIKLFRTLKNLTDVDLLQPTIIDRDMRGMCLYEQERAQRLAAMNDPQVKLAMAKLKAFLKETPTKKCLRLLSQERNMSGGHASFETIHLD